MKILYNRAVTATTAITIYTNNKKQKTVNYKD